MSTGFTFGAKTTTSAFGQAAPAFGQPTGSITFGTPVAASTAPPQFGMTAPPIIASQPTGSITFGTPVPPGLGAQFGTTSAGLSFGTNVCSTAPAFSIPSLNLKAPSTGLTFGTPSTAASTGLSFGLSAPAANASIGTTPTTGLAFSIPATTAPTSGLFGTTAPSLSAPGLQFGATATAATTAPLLNFGVPLSTAAATLNFGTPASTASTGLKLNFASTTPATTGLSFGLSGANAPKLPTTTGAVSFNLSGKPETTPTTSRSVGLGGIATSQVKTSTAASTKAEIAPKDQPLPNEILQTVEHFKNFVKEQKSYSSDVAKCSIKEFRKVEADIDSLNCLLNEVETQLQKNRVIAEKLKQETANGLQSVEIAQRTQDIPAGLQYDNSAPLIFFTGVVDNFEREMQRMKLQIENIEKYVKKSDQPGTLTSQDLAAGMRKLHETFVALAGRLQSVHNQVESQQEQYLNLRKYMLNDPTNVFEKPSKEAEALGIAVTMTYSPPKVASGPTPFNNALTSTISMSNLQQAPPPAYPGGSSFGMNPTPSGFNPPITSTSLFGNTPSFNFAQSTALNPQSPGFQLQRPPTGNKRGKQ